MSPATFPQANVIFGPPADLDESQVSRIPAHLMEIKSGSLDGERAVIVAWLPDQMDLQRLMKGHAVYITMIGGLAPHKLATTFAEATAL